MSESPLRRELEAAMNEHRLSMKDLTVLEKSIDPFRLDTETNHRYGKWLGDTVAGLGLEGRKIHLRGLHYAIIGRPKPDGQPYTNTVKDWEWLVADAGKAARFLGYIDFDQITDNRNDPPIVRVFTKPEPKAWILTGVNIDVPHPDDLMPQADVDDFDGVQPYKLVMIGEKSSLEPVLGPIALSYRADLYLPSGHASDTMIHTMAKTGATDGRPMVVLYFADCDPSGWNMPIEVARKLKAFRTLLFPELEFQVHRVGLTPDQVREFDLPSTPLKATEQRADRWQAAMGVQQTEIDALTSLRPDLLRQLARDALAPFFDLDLDRRVFEARGRWLDAAQDAVNSQLDQQWLEALRAEAGEKLAELQDEIDALNQALRVDASSFRLPEITVPEAQLNGGGVKTPLCDSRWSFAEQTKRLIASKHYREGGAQ